MSTEYFNGFHWKDGKLSNKDNDGIDRSVWLENEKQPYNIGDHNANLYLLEDLNTEGIFKVGIASNVYTRCKQINSDCKALRLSHNFNIADYVFIGERCIAERFEMVVLEKYRYSKVYKRSLFCGATELFKVNRSQILADFSKLKSFKKSVNIA